MGSGSTIAIAHLAETLFFGSVPDDILVNILCRLDQDPRDLARLACVSMRFCKLIKTVCWKFRCEKNLPLLVAELLQSPSPALLPCPPEPPGGWAALQKLLVCCPGLWHAGVLLENWDFGLDREIGWFDNFCYPGGVIQNNEGVSPELGHTHVYRSLGGKSRDRYARLGAIPCLLSSAECNAHGLNARITCFDVDGIVTHASSCVCDLDVISARTISPVNEAGMHCDRNEAHMHRNVNGTEADIEQGECKKKGNMIRHKHCPGVENTVSDIINGDIRHVTKLLRDGEFEEGAIEPLDNSHGLEASGIDGSVVADNHCTQRICKPPCMESLLALPNNDALNHVSLETSCIQESKELNRRNLVSTDAMIQEKRKRKHRQNPNKRQRGCDSEHCHFTIGPWNLSREQGNKLLANRFRADSLYICDWPGCVHPGDKRMYKLFRGVFKNFKSSHVWRNLKDMQAKATNVGCAFCMCKSTWDMVTTFCLKRSIEYHDDGEPVVRAYVCENGHVAGAWTDRPMYTL